MTQPADIDATDRERRLDEAIAAYLAAEDAGNPPPRDEFVARDPELSDGLRSFFREHDRLGRLAEPLRAAGDPVATTVAPFAATAGSEATSDTEADDPIPPFASPVVPGIRIRYFGDYELLKVLGQGGMGVVYEVRQISLNRIVALKLIRAGAFATDDDLRRFQNEAESVATLDHPHIIPIFEVGEYDGQRFFSMKRIAGGSLADGLARFVDDPPAAALVLAQVAEAVHHAHQRGILHRDLKPANILLDERGQPYVTDFGLAKRLEAPGGLTLSGAVMGTPGYMAPEQTSGRRGAVTTATDVHGLGAVLYALLTGRAPFVGDSMVETLEQVRGRAPEPPARRNPRVARDLEVICLKCLEKDPARRYASALALAEDLRRFLAREPILARPVGVVTRAWLWCRRKPALAGMVSGLVAAIVMGMIGITWYWSEARRRQEAELRGKLARQAVNLLARVPETDFDTRIDPLKTELLENVLGYFQRATARADRDPAVRLEDGRTYQQMGDILRTLGRLADSERAYRRSAELLQPQPAAAGGLDRERKRTLARTQTLLADLLIRRGTDPDQAGALYRQSVEDQQALANEPASAVEERLELGHTLRGQGDLLRLQGQFAQARTVYDRAVAVLELARGTDARHAGIRNELALAIDARGWIHREVGEIQQAERDSRQALGLLEALIIDFPTVPRHRETLIRICRGLALLEQETGRLAEAEVHYRQALPQVERLAQDFPEHIEYHRGLARTLSSLGGVLVSQHRREEAEPILLRAVEAIVPVAARSTDDIQIRFELARAHQRLGEIQLEKGDLPAALASTRQAIPISEELVRRFPDRPRYDDLLAMNLTTLARVQTAEGQPDSDGTFRAAAAIHDKLVAAHPDNVDYRIGRAHCLRDRATALATTRPDQAEAVYRQALARLEDRAAKEQPPECLQLKAEILNDLGSLDRAGAEESLVQSIAISRSLTSRRSSAGAARYNMAIAQFNLAELFMKTRRLPDAGVQLAEAVANFEKLVAEAPRSLDFQSQLGSSLAMQGKWFGQVGRLVEAPAALRSAVEHQRLAVQLSKNGPTYRELLGRHLDELARVYLELGDYDMAGRIALEISRTVPPRTHAQAGLDGARILARLLARVGDDAKLAQGDRDRMTRTYFGHTVGLLHEAIVRNPGLLDRVVTDPVFETLRRHPALKAILTP